MMIKTLGVVVIGNRHINILMAYRFMREFAKNNLRKELLLGVSAIGLIILMTIISVNKIHQWEDLSLLQLDFTDTIVEAKICLDKGGIVQDPSHGEQGKVFICSSQKITKGIFPSLEKLSRRGYHYEYLSSDKCFNKECAKKENTRVNIGKGRRLILSCDIVTASCQMK